MSEGDVKRAETPQPSPQPSDLLTVVEQVYFHPADREPRMVDSRWFRSLTTKGEQPYERYLKAGPEWQHLDLGWISEAGMVVIQNEEGPDLAKKPLPGQRTRALPSEDPMTIEVRYASAGEDDCFLVMPRESLRFQPTNAKEVVLRCRGGVAKYHLFVVPR